MASSSNLNVIGYSRVPSPSSHLSSPSHVALVTVTVVIAVAVTLSLAVYFFLRYRHCFFRRSSPSSATTFSSTNRISPETASPSVAFSLPAFTFSSVTRRSVTSSGGADCAVCLSKFEQHDLLRLLPLCCHAFHAECIDTWLRSNLTCPLCRSVVTASESDLAKVFRSSSVAGGESFRLEIGNISSGRRGAATADATGGDGDTRGRSYSVGAFEYLIEEEAEIELDYHAHRISVSGEKDDVAPVETPADSLAEDVGFGGNSNGFGWLKDYVDRLSVSFRSSGRFFTGSSRLSDVVAGELDIEANRFGEEIGEMFRWLSGV